MDVGIVGLPNAGKSTLFNALTLAGAATAPYAFCTVEPNVGVVSVPEPRLDVLARIEKSAKTTPALFQFVDIAGLVRGASKGEGLGNQFLAAIREVDAIAHVVRCFRDPNVPHTEGAPDPVRDVEIIDTELVLADLDTAEKTLDKARKMAKGQDKEALLRVQVLERIHKALGEGKGARTVSRTPEEAKALQGLSFITDKPVLFVANVGEGEGGKDAETLAALAKASGIPLVPFSARIEHELRSLSKDEETQMRKEMAPPGEGMEGLIRAAFRLLKLIQFFTAGPTESRAWPVPEGSTAPKAAGKIHTDFEKNFIRAEIVDYESLAREGSMVKVKEKGLLRLEGRDYVMKDGDVVLFRFGNA